MEPNTNNTTNRESRSLKRLVMHRVETRVIVTDPVTNYSKWGKPEVEMREVHLLAKHGTWAWVAKPGCVPYTCLVKELVHNKQSSVTAGQKGKE